MSASDSSVARGYESDAHAGVPLVLLVTHVEAMRDVVKTLRSSLVDSEASLSALRCVQLPPLAT